MGSHSGWVEFMCEVAQFHRCVFWTWIPEDPRSGISLSNDDEKRTPNQGEQDVPLGALTFRWISPV